MNGRFLNTNKLCRALLQYKNTPSRKDGLFPAQKLYGHPIQDILPAHNRSFAPEWQRSTAEAEEHANTTLDNSRQYYNSSAHPLPEIKVGTNVAVQDHRTKLWDTYGIVTAIGPQRKYHVKIQMGNTLVRNKRFVCRRVADSVPYFRIQEPLKTAESGPENIPQPRQSMRAKKSTQRLIEDPAWP